LFEQLVDVTQSSYSSASGIARQQDLIRAQLELTRLDGRLTELQQHHDAIRRKLGEWLPVELLAKPFPGAIADIKQVHLIPENDRQQLFNVLLQHPRVKSVDKTIEAAIHRFEAGKTDRLLLLRELASRYEEAVARLQRLDQRQRLYREQLLLQIHEQAEASLNAYTMMMVTLPKL
jgi:hypothetical protein